MALLRGKELAADSKLTKLTNQADILLVIGVILSIIILIVPVSPFILDISLTLLFSFTFVIMMVVIYSESPIQFSVFPSVLLFVTLIKLALNVATTRQILLRAYAGKLILSFGDFVIGGNYIIGVIIFILIYMVNARVIVKGSGRIAEVAARFTLDAMPGKQMSIDADLNQGLITEDEARAKRNDLSKEAEFYGAMDGAAKFVSGDVNIGLLITVVNILGGIAIGMWQLGMPLKDALSKYAVLTIGDGLVSQIPSMIISVTAGLLVTKVKSDVNLGQDMAKQLLGRPKAFMLAASSMFAFALIPGLPFIPFAIVGSFLGGTSYVMKKFIKNSQEEQDAQEVPNDQKIGTGAKVEKLLHPDLMELEIGYGLIPMVDVNSGGDLLDRITHIRKQLAVEMGIIVPPIRIRDNMSLLPEQYRILIKGIESERGEVKMSYMLAMDPGTVKKKIDGMSTVEPAFGLPAVWINKEQKERAEINGYTVVDPISVIATHLTEAIRKNMHELLTRQDVQKLLDTFKETYPAIVDEVVPNIVSASMLQRILQNLVKEGVPIRDLLTILECLAEYGLVTKDVELLTEKVRQALSRGIGSLYKSDEGNIKAITLDPQLEQNLLNSIKQTETQQSLVINPSFAQQIFNKMAEQMETVVAADQHPILICTSSLRPHLRKLTERIFSNLVILSYNEIPANMQVKPIGMVSVGNESQDVSSQQREGNLTANQV